MGAKSSRARARVLKSFTARPRARAAGGSVHPLEPDACGPTPEASSPGTLRLPTLELLPGQFLLQAAKPVHEQATVEVVRLMTDGSCEQARALDLAHRARRVAGAHPHPGGADHPLGDVGHRQT